MAQRIYKYPLRIDDDQTIELPMMARVLSVGLDPAGSLCVWAMVDTLGDKEDVSFRIIGTGNPVGPGTTKHFTFLGTVTKGVGVWHVFYRKP